MNMLLNDLTWAWRMLRIRRVRRGLRFSLRKAYDDALRPSSGSAIVGYPDAIYFIEKRDMLRAAGSAEWAFLKATALPSQNGEASE